MTYRNNVKSGQTAVLNYSGSTYESKVKITMAEGITSAEFKFTGGNAAIQSIVVEYK